jgi:hypothetical protein
MVDHSSSPEALALPGTGPYLPDFLLAVLVPPS